MDPTASSKVEEVPTAPSKVEESPTMDAEAPSRDQVQPVLEKLDEMAPQDRMRVLVNILKKTTPKTPTLEEETKGNDATPLPALTDALTLCGGVLNDLFKKYPRLVESIIGDDRPNVSVQSTIFVMPRPRFLIQSLMVDAKAQLLGPESQW